MPIHMETSASQGVGIHSYWLQVLQAGHWRNLEQVLDAGTAMIRTGTLAQGNGFDAVRLLEARFHDWKGQTEFHEIVTFDTNGAHFAGSSGNTVADHVRMDLAGTIAPLLPSAIEKGDVAKLQVNAFAPETPRDTQAFQAPMSLGSAFPTARDSRKATPPGRNVPTDGRPLGTARSSMRARLLTGVMAGAFVAGVTISALRPEQSGDIAAAIYERVGIHASKISDAVAVAPKQETTVPAEAQTGVQTEAQTEAWPLAWGDTAEKTAPISALATSPATAPATAAEEPKQFAAFQLAQSGTDLEAENRQPAGNMLPATLAAPVVPAPKSAVQIATREAAPAAAPAPVSTPAMPRMTAAQAYAMQASLPQPIENYTPPVAVEVIDTVQVADVKDSGLRLTTSGAGKAAPQGAAFTTAVAGDAAQLGTIEVWPRPPLRSPAVQQRAAQHSALADAIEQGSVEDLLKLISGPVQNVSVASLSDTTAGLAVSAGNPDLTSLLDFALLQGRPDHAQALARLGAAPSDGALNALARSADMAALTRIAPIVRKVGIDPDRMTGSGITPLMQAAQAGNAQLVEALLTLGADPAFETGAGLRASDYAARGNHTAVQENLVLAADQSLYTPIMFGLSWSDTLDTVKARSNVCKRVGEGFVACSLKTDSWLDDTAAIIAQFDTRNGNRLVAIQVDSHLYDNPDAAEVGFKKAAQLIAKVLPPDQFGFPVRDIPPDAAMFQSLTPSVGTGQYFQYWPDDNLRRPVYVHMKMIGYKQDRGFHRIVIGNPFRVG